MSKNIPKPIVRVGYIRKDGSLSHEIDGNKVKNMDPSQFSALVSELSKVRRKLVYLRDRNAHGEVLTPKQYEEIEKCVSDGHLLAGVKLYKTYTGVGLKDAKAFVDSVRETI